MSVEEEICWLTSTKNYLVRLVTTTDLSPTSSFWVYLNNVGIMHTGLPGFKHREKRPELRVEYIHMSVLLGYVVDIVVGAVSFSLFFPLFPSLNF